MNSNITYGVVGFVLGLLVGMFAAPQFMGNGMMRGGQMGMGGDRASHIDSRFIEAMIPHHEGAIAMAQLALERSKRPEILSLAQGVIDAQTRENQEMRAWYKEWYGEAPAEVGMGHGMHMQGMEGDLDALTGAANFDIEFLDQMIVHHEMAIMMANMLAGGTERPEMKNLADQIITSQSREIDMMRSWRAAWTERN